MNSRTFRRRRARMVDALYRLAESLETLLHAQRHVVTATRRIRNAAVALSAPELVALGGFGDAFDQDLNVRELKQAVTQLRSIARAFPDTIDELETARLQMHPLMSPGGDA